MEKQGPGVHVIISGLHLGRGEGACAVPCITVRDGEMEAKDARANPYCRRSGYRVSVA